MVIDIMQHKRSTAAVLHPLEGCGGKISSFVPVSCVKANCGLILNACNRKIMHLLHAPSYACSINRFFSIAEAEDSMKALVAVKRVVDYNVKVRVKADKTGVDLTNVKMSINPFCEIAVEEAVRLKEKGVVTEIVVVSVGPSTAQEQIRSAMALGADRGILVQTDDAVGPLAVAKILKGIVDQEQPQIILMGKQAIDDDNNQTGQMLAALMGVGQGTFASKVTVENGVMNVEREVDGGAQTVALPLPAIVTTDLRLNEPRYAALPNIMKARKKPLDTKTPADYGVDTASKLKTLKVEPPAERKAGIKVKSVDELVEKLKNEAKVI
jgi:electron transfer flavoprotein beta subunit